MNSFISSLETVANKIEFNIKNQTVSYEKQFKNFQLKSTSVTNLTTVNLDNTYSINQYGMNISNSYSNLFGSNSNAFYNSSYINNLILTSKFIVFLFNNFIEILLIK